LLKTYAIEETIYKLSDLLEEIQMVVRSSFDRSYWVIAEIVSVSEAKNGHLYLEVAEKENDFLQAKIRANLWSNTKRRILSEFEYITNQTLKKGMKVLINVSLDFHTVFGLSLTILDIDPNFSLGEIERQKQETIQRLEQEGLIDFNKQHVLAHALQSIAIISSETAAGYQDFMKHLSDNDFGYRFQTQLFQASMQGELASKSIIQALEHIEESRTNFDAVVLIRGGGSSLDLNCFNEYELAARMAQSIFPIFTGIGHERDSSIADKVAHTPLKTPTAVANFILDYNRNFEENLESLANQINNLAFDFVEDQKDLIGNLRQSLSFHSQQKLYHHSQLLLQQSHQYQQAVRTRINKASYRLDKMTFILQHDLKLKLQKIDLDLDATSAWLNQKITNSIKLQGEKLQHHSQTLQNKSKQLIETQNRKMLQIEQIIQLADPIQILKKGFSISRMNGKLLTSAEEIEKNAILTTELKDGIIESKITNINHYE
jgi:exodeoxyribonuclease VII large subunit